MLNKNIICRNSEKEKHNLALFGFVFVLGFIFSFMLLTGVISEKNIEAKYYFAPYLTMIMFGVCLYYGNKLRNLKNSPLIRTDNSIIFTIETGKVELWWSDVEKINKENIVIDQAECIKFTIETRNSKYILNSIDYVDKKLLESTLVRPSEDT